MRKKIIDINNEMEKYNRNEKIINICKIILMICLILDIILIPTWIVLKIMEL